MNAESRRWPHLMCAALLSGVLVLLVLLVATPVQADPQDEDSSGVSVELTQINPSVLRPGDDLTIRGTITNDSDEVVENPIIRMQMQAHVPSSRAELAGWLDGSISANIVALTAQELETEIEPGSSASFTVAIPEEDSPFSGVPAWGPRGFEVSASTPQVSASARNVLLWFPEESPLPAPSELTVLAPFTPTLTEWNEALASDTPVGQVAADRIQDLMSATDQGGVTWAVDPAILEDRPPTPTPLEDLPPAEEVTVEDSGEQDDSSEEQQTPAGGTTEPAQENGNDLPGLSAPAELADVIADLSTGARGRDVIQLDYANADISALAHAQDLTMWRVGTERGERLLSEAEINVLADVRWPAGRIDGQTLAALASEGTQSVVLSETTLPPDPALTTSAPARTQTSTSDGPLDAVVWQSDLSALLTGQSPEGEDLESLLARQMVLAETALLVREGDEDVRGLLAALPRTATGDGVGSHIDELAEAPWLQLTNLRGLLGRAATNDLRIPPPQTLTDSRRLHPEVLQDRETDHDTLTTFADIVSDRDLLLDSFQPAILTTLSHTWVTDPAARTDLAEGSAATVAQLQDSIGVELGSTPNLIARTGELPITIENRLPMAADVVVGLEPDDPRLRAPEQVEAHLEPQTFTTVQVPIQGVANGNVGVSVEVRDTLGGVSVSEGAEFAVRVRADWEDIGTVIVVGLLGVAFVIGLARTIRSGRRTEKAAATAGAGADE